MTTDVKKAFATWLEMTFLKWQAEKGKRASLQEFADHIGYSRPLISMWLAGKRLPGEDGIERLAELFGPEVYDIIQLPRPDPYLQSINSRWSRIPVDKQQQLAPKEHPALIERGCFLCSADHNNRNIQMLGTDIWRACVCGSQAELNSRACCKIQDS